MLSERAVCVTALLLLACCVLHSKGGSVTVIFAESDASGSESSTSVTATVRMSGNNDGPVTLVVVPLTVDQYLNESGKYERSCDTLITSIADLAEVEDFNTAPVSQVISSDATDTTGSVELPFMIDLVDDVREEEKESFFLWLNGSTSDDRDSVTFTAGRRCVRVDIVPDGDAITLEYTPLVTEVSEGDGTVDVVRINKQGVTELTTIIDLSGSLRNTFTVAPNRITLEPEDTTATVNITLLDDDFPEDDLTGVVIASVKSGNIHRFEVLIKDNDYATIGFDQIEVTVIEGETVTLTTSLKNNVSLHDYLRSEFFEVFTSPGKGNATALDHYTNFSNPFYFPGDPIRVSTVDDDNLETSRQFEVRLRDPSENPLNILDPNHVIITIIDNDGTPNTPTITGITSDEQSNGDISVTWKIETHKLRPVLRYILSYSVTEKKTGVSKPEETDRGEIDNDNRMLGRQRFNVTVSQTDLTCKLNATGNHCKHIIKLEGEFKTGVTHDIVVVVCAENDFGHTCGEPRTAILMPAPLSGQEPKEPKGLSPGVIAGVVVVMVAIFLLCCLLWTIVALLCGFCVGGGREIKYHPEKREKKNEEQLEKYRRVENSESPAPVDV